MDIESMWKAKNAAVQQATTERLNGATPGITTKALRAAAMELAIAEVEDRTKVPGQRNVGSALSILADALADANPRLLIECVRAAYERAGQAITAERLKDSPPDPYLDPVGL